jgi:hypothetical protein
MAPVVSASSRYRTSRGYPPAQYVGIVVLRLPDTAVAQEIAQVLERFVMESKFLDALAGRLAIVEVDRVRFRL